MEAMIKESYHSSNRLQYCFPVRLSRSSWVLILLLLSSMNFADTCDSDLTRAQRFDDFFIRVWHASDTTVRFTWYIPQLVRKTIPQYYCIVYNNRSERVRAFNQPFQNGFIQNLTIDTNYDLTIKACIDDYYEDICFAKSETFRVRTRWY